MADCLSYHSAHWPILRDINLHSLISNLINHYVYFKMFHKQLRIDESLIPFKSCASAKKYIPPKPIKKKYKLWMRADIEMFISKFDVSQEPRNLCQ